MGGCPGGRAEDAPAPGVAKPDGGGAGASTSFWEDPRRQDRLALPRRLLGTPSTHLRRQRKAGGGGGGGRQRIPGSAIPGCPGWGETTAAHFLSNPARRPTSLATSVIFNNFIGIRTVGRECRRGRAGQGREGRGRAGQGGAERARYWLLEGAQHALVFHSPKECEERAMGPIPPVPQFPHL